MTQCNFKFKTHLWKFICSLKRKPWWSLKDNLEGTQTKWMNLKFWFREHEFWKLRIFHRSGSNWWFPSPKQINGFQNQNLHKNLNGTNFARTFWFLVKVHIKANSHRITLFENFWILKWRNRPQNRNLHEKLSKTSPSWKFWLSVKIYTKVNFLEIGLFAQFFSLRWRNGFQNWNVLEKLSKTGIF